MTHNSTLELVMQHNFFWQLLFHRIALWCTYVDGQQLIHAELNFVAQWFFQEDFFFFFGKVF